MNHKPSGVELEAFGVEHVRLMMAGIFNATGARSINGEKPSDKHSADMWDSCHLSKNTGGGSENQGTVYEGP